MCSADNNSLTNSENFRMQTTSSQCFRFLLSELPVLRLNNHMMRQCSGLTRRQRRQSCLHAFEFYSFYNPKPDLCSEFPDETGSLKSDAHLTPKDIAKLIRKDFQLILVDHELKMISPKTRCHRYPEHQYDFSHGKSLLRSMKFDSLSYPSDVLVELCIEIFEEVTLGSLLVLLAKLDPVLPAAQSAVLLWHLTE